MSARPLAVAAIIAFAVSSASALTVPFTENFGTTANWRQATSTLAVNLVGTGGPAGAGDSYVSYDRALPSTTASSTVFRGQDEFDASGDAFVGDWVAGNVKQFSFFVRHNASANLVIGARLAVPGNTPAVSTEAPMSVAPNVWTQITVTIDPSNPLLIPEGNFPVNDVFSQIANVQISAARPASIPTGTLVTFDLDRVSISSTPVPEPATAAVLGLATLPLLARRRRA